jgi:hypothetical protein
MNTEVLRNAAVGSPECPVSGAGRQKPMVWAMDPGVVLERIVVDLGGLQPSYLVPPETRPEN